MLPSTSGGFWKVRNQWGSGWGEQGFVRLSFGSNTCNAFFMQSYFTTPQLLPSHWILEVESVFLVFRYSNPAKDIRVAFEPGVYKDFGTPSFYNNEALNVLYSSGTWSIEEETGVLVIRDQSSAADHRYAFFPGSGSGYNFGSGPEVGEFGEHTLYAGYRWSINVENGVLVFRDKLSPGDNRYAFYQNYVDTWNRKL